MIASSAAPRRYRWLDVLDPTHHCSFLIDGVPVRFFRGDTEDPSKRTLVQRGIKAQQLALALGTAKGSEDILLYGSAAWTH